MVEITMNLQLIQIVEIHGYYKGCMTFIMAGDFINKTEHADWEWSFIGFYRLDFKSLILRKTRVTFRADKLFIDYTNHLIVCRR